MTCWPGSRPASPTRCERSTGWCSTSRASHRAPSSGSDRRGPACGLTPVAGPRRPNRVGRRWHAGGMGTPVQASISWQQALSWRLQRQLLDPVGSESVAGVVGRLGAVLSMDESLAELAVRTRRSASRPGQLATALAEGKVIKAFAFRGSMHYLSPEEWKEVGLGSRWDGLQFDGAGGGGLLCLPGRGGGGGGGGGGPGAGWST